MRATVPRESGTIDSGGVDTFCEMHGAGHLALATKPVLLVNAISRFIGRVKR